MLQLSNPPPVASCSLFHSKLAAQLKLEFLKIALKLKSPWQSKRCCCAFEHFCYSWIEVIFLYPKAVSLLPLLQSSLSSWVILAIEAGRHSTERRMRKFFTPVCICRLLRFFLLLSPPLSPHPCYCCCCSSSSFNLHVNTLQFMQDILETTAELRKRRDPRKLLFS